MRSGSVLTLMLVLMSGAAYAGPEDATSARAEFERLARELPYMAQQSMLAEAPRAIFRTADPDVARRHDELMDELRARTDTLATLRGLLRHDAPKVRTLALVALYRRADPQLLPEIAALREDKALTFLGHPALSPEWLAHTGIGPPAKQQTVGDIASAILAACGMKRGEAAEVYWWEGIKAPAQSLRWLLARMEWARRTPEAAITDSRASRLVQVRALVEALPQPAQTWAFLRLHRESLGNDLVSEKALVGMLRGLGSDVLVRLLQRKISSADPGLQPSMSSNHGYHAMCTFVLRHATELLRVTDVPAIRACAAFEQDYRANGLSNPMQNGWWYIAAARLQPKRAREHLHAGMQALAEDYPYIRAFQADIQLAAHRVIGASGDAAILEWFFAADPGLHSSGAARATFVDRLGVDAPAQRLIARIIHDERWSGLDWFTIRSLALAASEWLKPPILTRNAAYQLSHPLGARAFLSRIPDQDAETTKATKRVLATLARWHAELKRRVPAPK